MEDPEEFNPTLRPALCEKSREMAKAMGRERAQTPTPKVERRATFGKDLNHLNTKEVSTVSAKIPEKFNKLALRRNKSANQQKLEDQLKQKFT